MFGVVEGFAVAGAVAAIVSAFQDGREMYRNWRKTKKKQRENDEVQESLRRNLVTIEKRYEDFHRRLGDTFAKGDDIAQQQLERALLKYNRTMVKCLTVALQQQLDPDVTEFFARSEKTAKDTLNTLGDLHQRLRIRCSISRNPELVDNSTWMPPPNPDHLEYHREYSTQQTSYPLYIGKSSVESLSLDLEAIRRRSITISVRGESSVVLERNLAILSRRGL